ncbi:hypothetical protein CERSUDRAFT_123530 [Gelatoporia subvermispora B]|uniref:Uncharacterized protein n=1 Tax=Ceriporiopsis subvermispora (strain B) TaxID=914234 RepID=M2RGM6_CERS8|nr:hypothetical protein CERSUDRAFT_123530 [Gelatoporia subvermispora B]
MSYPKYIEIGVSRDRLYVFCSKHNGLSTCNYESLQRPHEPSKIVAHVLEIIDGSALEALVLRKIHVAFTLELAFSPWAELTHLDLSGCTGVSWWYTALATPAFPVLQRLTLTGADVAVTQLASALYTRGRSASCLTLAQLDIDLLPGAITYNQLPSTWCRDAINPPRTITPFLLAWLRIHLSVGLVLFPDEPYSDCNTDSQPVDHVAAFSSDGSSLATVPTTLARKNRRAHVPVAVTRI